jgi:hypothetical protein
MPAGQETDAQARVCDDVGGAGRREALLQQMPEIVDVVVHTEA